MEAQATHAEPDAPAASAPHCPNCGAAPRGRYCHDCGQKQRARLRLAGALLRDGIGTFLSLDFRIVPTLRRLLFAPGRLTEAYLEGRRARFTKPFRLYLLASAVYFVVQAFAPRADTFFGVLSVDTANSAELRAWLPRLMFVLVPAFALLLKGFYTRHGRLYAEHLIFSLHYFSFYFALNTLLTPLQHVSAPASGTSWLAPAFAVLNGALVLLVPVVYLAVALHRVYEQSVVWSVAKGIGLYLAYLLIFAIFLVALFTAGVAG